MILNVGDTVIVQNTSLDGKVIDEGIAKIIRITNRLDHYMVRFEEDLDGMDQQLFLRFVPVENKIQ